MIRHRIIYDDGSWEEWEGEASPLKVPEYHPSPRVEAWLTLPPGVMVKRDDPDYERPEVPDPPRYPRPNPRTRTAMAFVREFGMEAGVKWGLVPVPFDWIMQDVWSSERMSKLFFQENQFLDKLTNKIEGRVARIPIAKS